MGPGTTSSSNIYTVLVHPTGDVLAGGNFSQIGGTTASRIARYSMATGTWSPLGAGLTNGGVVYAIAVLPGGDYIAGGQFTGAGGINLQHIARYNPTTNVWSNMNSQMVSSGDEVRALAVEADGNVIVAGTFLNGGGVGAVRIARYNPTNGVWSALGSGLNNTVEALAILPGGDIIAAGYFSTAGGVPASRIARYNATTGWSALGTGLTGGFQYVKELALTPGGDVIVGGSFTVADGVTATRIARYNPTSGLWSALGVGTNNDVNGLAMLPGGDVVAVGFFTSPGTRIARYTFGGTAPGLTTQPSPVSTCPSGVATFSVVASGTDPLSYQWQWTHPTLRPAWTAVVIGDNLDVAGAPVFNTLGSPLATMDVSPISTPPGTTYPFITWSVPIAFRCVVTNTCGSVTSNEATLTVCAADFNCSGGTPDDADVASFFLSWNAGDPEADLNGSGGTPDDADVTYFFERWNAGC